MNSWDMTHTIVSRNEIKTNKMVGFILEAIRTHKNLHLLALEQPSLKIILKSPKSTSD